MLGFTNRSSAHLSAASPKNLRALKASGGTTVFSGRLVVVASSTVLKIHSYGSDFLLLGNCCRVQDIPIFMRVIFGG